MHREIKFGRMKLQAGDGEYACAGAIAGVGVNLVSSAAGEFD